MKSLCVALLLLGLAYQTYAECRANPFSEYFYSFPVDGGYVDQWALFARNDQGTCTLTSVNWTVPSVQNLYEAPGLSVGCSLQIDAQNNSIRAVLNPAIDAGVGGYAYCVINHFAPGATPQNQQRLPHDYFTHTSSGCIDCSDATCRIAVSFTARSGSGSSWTNDGIQYQIYDISVTNIGTQTAKTFLSFSDALNNYVFSSWNYNANDGSFSNFGGSLAAGSTWQGAGIIFKGSQSLSQITSGTNQLISVAEC